MADDDSTRTYDEENDVMAQKGTAVSLVDDTDEHLPSEPDLDGDTDDDGLIDDGAEDVGATEMDLEKDDNALDMEHRLGLYTDVDEENPEELNIARELEEQGR